MPTKALLSFLFASFLLYPLVRAAETESKPAPAAKPAKSAAKPKAKPKPKLKKVKWLWGQSSVKSQMASLDASLKDQQGKNDQLEVQVRETRSRIARLEAALIAASYVVEKFASIGIRDEATGQTGEELMTQINVALEGRDA